MALNETDIFNLISNGKFINNSQNVDNNSPYSSLFEKEKEINNITINNNSKNKNSKNKNLNEKPLDYNLKKLLGYTNNEIFNPNTVTEQKNRAFWQRALEQVSEWAVGDETDWDNYLKRGLGKSTINVGLQNIGRGYDYKKAFSPEPDDTGIAERAFESMVTIAADMPFFLAGALGAGAITQNPVAAGAAAGFVNDSIKGMFLGALERGDVDTFSEWWEQFLNHGIEEGAKGGLVMAAMVAAPSVLSFPASKALGVPINKLTVGMSRWAGLTGAGAAVDGQFPNWETMVNNGILLGAFGMFDPKAKQMSEKSAILNQKDTITETIDIKNDIVSKQEILSKNINNLSKNKEKTQKEVILLEKELIELNKLDKKTKPKIIDNKINEIVKIEKEIKKLENNIVDPLTTDSIRTLNKTKIDILKQDLKDIKENTGKIIEEKDVFQYEKNRKINLNKELIVLEKKQKSMMEDLNLLKQKVLENGEGAVEVGSIAKLTKDIKLNQENIVNTTKLINKNKRIKEIELELENLGSPVKKTYDKDQSPLKKEHPDPDINSVLEQTSLGKIKYTELLDKGKSSFIKNWLDKLYPIKKIVEEANKQGIKEKGGALNVYQRFRILVGNIGKGYHFIEKATLDFNTLKNNGKSFKEILGKIIKTNNEYQEFTGFAIAKRAMEKFKQGITTSYTLTLKGRKELTNIIKNYESKYGKAFEEMNLYQQRVLTYLKDSGILSAKSYKTILELNKDYVPLNKLLDLSITKQVETSGINVINPLKKMEGTGSAKTTIDPIETMFLNTIRFVQMAERNSVNKALIDLVLLTRKTKKNNELFENIKKIKTYKRNENKQETPFRNDNWLKESEISFYVEGKLQVYEVGTELAIAMKGLSKYQTNIYFKIAGIPSRMLRAGATLEPDFVIKSLYRDTWFASAFSKNNFIPVVSSLRGVFHIVKGKLTGDKLWDDFTKSGGLQANLLSFDRTYFRNQQMYNELTTVNGKLFNTIKNPIEALRIFAEIFEQGARLGDFRLTLKRLKKENENKNPSEKLTEKEILETAGFETRDITVDFRKIGLQAEGLNMISAFFNARIQGLIKIGEGLSNKKTAPKVIKSGLLYITMPSVLLWYANKDSETYKNLPQWQKDLNWIIITNEGTPEETVWRLPKPFEIGWIFGTLPERMLDWAYSKDPEPFKESFNDITKGLFSTFTPLPEFAKVFVEDAANENFFTNRPIVARKHEDILPEYQYTPNTSETAKFIANVFAAFRDFTGQDELFGPSLDSPVKVDNYIKGWTGGLGKYLLQGIDKIAIELNLVKTPPPKPWSDNWVKNLSDIPIIKSFVIRTPSLNTKAIEDFWNKYKKIVKLQNTYNNMISDLQIKEGIDFQQNVLIKEFGESNLILLSSAPVLKEKGDLITIINNNTDMTPDEKRQQIDDIYIKMNQIAKIALKTLKELEAKK
jgi:hypothetical protein